MKVYHYDAFSKKPGMGNPAGIVFDADILSSDEMQKIAEKVGFNETVFVKSSEIADIKLQYFTPGHEMDLCGHGTIASIFALNERGLIDSVEKIETASGVLDIKLMKIDGEVRVRMKQNPAVFQSFNGSSKELSEALGIDASDISNSLPVLYGSTGIWTLIVPVNSIETIKKMIPVNRMFPEILKENKKASVHPFSFETFNDADMHGRHFSSPYSGTVEDPVTGTASGVMGAYYLKYIDKGNRVSLKIEQGHEVGKDGLVHTDVSFSEGEYHVEIEGTAVFVKEFEV